MEHTYFGETANPEPWPGRLISAERWGGIVRGVSIVSVRTCAVRRVGRLSTSLGPMYLVGAD